MGKMFQNASSLKPNCPGMIIGRASVFYADRKSKMAATTGHSINTGPYGENTEISSSLKMGSKTLPTIWGTYMKLVTTYQISAINSC
jgi:hypothetical protein